MDGYDDYGNNCLTFDLMYSCRLIGKNHQFCNLV